MRLLAARPHSSAELHRRLVNVCERRKAGKRAAADYAGVRCAAVCDALLASLREERLVADASYALWHVSQRARHRPRSAAALRGELGAKGVAREHVAAALDGFREDEAARAMIAKKRSSMPRERLLAFMQRKGFPYAVVARVLAEGSGATAAAPDAAAASAP